MKKGILTLAVLASISSMAVLAAEEEAADMSDPTAVYTTLGFSYGNQGLDMTSMLLLSSTETQKTGLIFDAKNMLDENDHKYNPIMDKHTHNSSFRLRLGTINTQNGLGGVIDAVNLDHPAFGRMSVVQAGPLATIPIGDDFIMFPVAFVGGVLVEDNTLDMLNNVAAPTAQAALADATAAAQTAGAEAFVAGKAAAEDPTNTLLTKAAADAAEAFETAKTAAFGATLASKSVDAQISSATVSSEGMSMASTIATGMVYARYAFTEKLWALGSYSYTKAIQGKSWSDDIGEGGLQMPSQQYDITFGYQITPTQNITALYGSDNSSATDDKWNIGYKYAF